MSCLYCGHAEEYEEEIDGETWLLRRCEMSENHVDDDYTCPYDTSKDLNVKINNIIKQLEQADKIAKSIDNARAVSCIDKAIKALNEL